MCHPYIESTTALSDYYEELQEFPFFCWRVAEMDFQRLAEPQKCECTLEI